MQVLDPNLYYTLDYRATYIIIGYTTIIRAAANLSIVNSRCSNWVYILIKRKCMRFQSRPDSSTNSGFDSESCSPYSTPVYHCILPPAGVEFQ